MPFARSLGEAQILPGIKSPSGRGKVRLEKDVIAKATYLFTRVVVAPTPNEFPLQLILRMLRCMMKKRVKAILSFGLLFLFTITTIFYLSSNLAPSLASAPPQNAGTFAIYLLDSEVPATDLANVDLKRCSDRNPPIISTEDILTYTKDTHELELTKPAYGRVQQLFGAPVRVAGIPFAACVGEEPIYVGAFWSPASSLSHGGVVIVQPFSTEEQTIRITLGYASPVVYVDSDPRADRRIMEALDTAGKLKTLPCPSSKTLKPLT